jgi:outer membrane protein TolC
MPLGNRLACARLRRRQVELRRLQTEYTQAINAIQTEVDIAVREMNTAYREIGAKSRALIAAEAEARTIRVRWARMVDGGGNSGLNLESLLRAQERVTQAENEFVTAMLTYNLAIVNLKRANGTLLQTNNVVISKSCDNCAGPQTILDVAENPTEEIVR